MLFSAADLEAALVGVVAAASLGVLGMVMCCMALFWYWDRGISSLHAEIVERLS